MLVNMHASPRLFNWLNILFLYCNVLMHHNTFTAADFGDNRFFGSNTKFAQGDKRYRHDRRVGK